MLNNLMFKKVVVTLFFLSASLLHLNCSKPITNLDSKGKNIICFGNSITYGVGAPEGEDYSSFLASNLSYPVINAGKPGDTTSQALKRLKSDVLSKDPLMVIVILGGNDFMMQVPRQKVFYNINKIIKTIQENGSIAVLGDISAGFIMGQLGKGYRKIAKDRCAVLVPDLLKGILDNPSYKSDSIHPNAKGYKLIAKRILNRIKPILQKNKQMYK